MSLPPFRNGNRFVGKSNPRAGSTSGRAGDPYPGVPRIGGPTPPTPPPGILLPDGTPAARSMEPGQAIAVDVVGKVASLPSLEQTLTDLADWRERQGPGHELAAGQRLTIQAVQMVARWRDEAQALVAKARGLPKPDATDAGGDGRIPPNP